MTVAQAQAMARARLEKVGAPEEARLLLQAALSCTLESLLLRRRDCLSDEEGQRLETLLAGRESGMPLQYLLGQWPFMGLPMGVREGVLIPRDDTETLAVEALRLAEERGWGSCLDLCTGSGCLAVALAALGGLAVTASDVSPAALRLAADNAAQNGVARLVTVVGSDLFDQIVGRFDMIVTNPPYIPTADIPTLMREVREHEPVLALDGGADGLDFYRRIAAEAPAFLNPGGALLAEVGAGQAQEVAALLEQNGFGEICVRKDLNGMDRVVTGHT